MRVTNKDMYADYKEKVFKWIEEQAKNPNVTEIVANIRSSDIDVEMSDTNGWQLDWWSDDIVEFGGRKWEVQGCAYYGTVTLSIPESDNDDSKCDNCICWNDCDYVADVEVCPD